MREIRYRAYYKPENRMIYDVQNEFEERIELGMNCFADYLNNDDFVVEQYTGFEDKNGKEIWEGDIVQFVSNGTTYDRQVIYKRDCGCYMLTKKNKTPYSFLEMYQMGVDEFEVVGNIHESNMGEK